MKGSLDKAAHHKSQPALSSAQSEHASKRGMTSLREWAEMIKFEHTIFALPFALSGLLLAAASLPSASTVCWTILAFTGARAAAMTLNRLIDAEIDALNPRTNTRAIPTGRIKRVEAAFFVFLSFALMLLAASNLPPLCLWLSPVAIAWLSFYSYTKRFTWMCHLVLGIALGGAALGGWIAASGGLTGWAPWLLALAVSTWVTGFDIIYACQDVDFDRDKRLFSLPASFGIAFALNVSAGLHVVTVLSLLGLGSSLTLGPIYFAGIMLVALTLVFEHSLVSAKDLSSVNAAFFTTNGLVSIAQLGSIFLDKILR